MTKTKLFAVLDFTMDEYRENGRCENVNENIRKHYKKFLEIRPDMATEFTDMIYGNVLYELLPELVAAGATFDENKILNRLADCEVNEKFINILNSVGISTDSIAEHYENENHWPLFLKNGLSPEWLTRDSEAAKSAIAFIAERGSKHGPIRELLEKCHPLLRKELFKRYLPARTRIRDCSWEWSDFFSLRPLIEAGVSEDEILKIICEYGHCDIVDLFESKDGFRALELEINPADYFLDFLNTSWERFGDESADYINEFCDNYAVDLDGVVCSIPRGWFMAMSKAYYSEGFISLLKRVGNMKRKLEEYLFPKGLPATDPNSIDCSDEEWLYLLIEGTV